ncbi:MAG TPA: hypothetical protein DDY13_00655 [Cytophagales bacterium]|nr:hypothetical protein [Cytophagales bacterium]
MTVTAQNNQAVDTCECRHACRCHFLGTVVDASTNEPLPFATIKVINPEKLTLADEHGHFAITNLWERLIELEVTYTGYKPFHTPPLQQ